MNFVLAIIVLILEAPITDYPFLTSDSEFKGVEPPDGSLMVLLKSFCRWKILRVLRKQLRLARQFCTRVGPLPTILFARMIPIQVFPNLNARNLLMV